MKKESRIAFSKRQRLWFIKRDKKCSAPFPHYCDSKNPLQLHHIKPHGYLKRVAPEILADFPENGIILCRTAHEMIHPDVVVARQRYNADNDSFLKLRDSRDALMDKGQIYWVEKWDRLMEVIALKNTYSYIKKHPFPVYKHRKHEVTEDTES